MKNKIQKKNISEEIIINKFLNKLNFNKKGTYNFKNDGAYIKINKNKKIIITTDSISEDIDFFKNDNPKSIANKLVTVNISDLSAMGVTVHSYSMNLFLPNYIDLKWLKLFTDELLRLQKKYRFYLIGGDLSSSKKLSISGTFYGFLNNNKNVFQNHMSLNNDIWVTGNLGDSFVGLQLLIVYVKLISQYFSYFFILIF